MSASIRQRVVVPFEYTVAFSRGVLTPQNPELARAIAGPGGPGGHRMLAVIDGGLATAQPGIVDRVVGYASAHRGTLDLIAPPLVVPGGERCKTDLTVLAALVAWIASHRLDRHAYLVAIGGGALLDVAGLAAATVHRGVRLVRVPTTVLSQADSGIGVKNGVNAFGQKNFLGTFAPPFAVVIDTSFLTTLAAEDAVAGYAEAVKVALLKDARFFRWIAGNADALARREPRAVENVVRRCAELHLEHIATAGDPFERGSNRPLDFGHWAAHKLEMMSGGRVRHGEAVAIGMAIDVRYAVATGRASPELARSVLATLARLGLKTWDPALRARDGSGRLAVLAGLEDFRQHLGGEPGLVLVTEPGRMAVVPEVDAMVMEDAIEGLAAREAA